MPEKPDVNTTVRQIEDLLGQLAASDPASRERAEEIIRLVMQLYGDGLGRVVRILLESDGGELFRSFTQDKLIASLLLLHGLHPEDAETRVRSALHRVERALGSHHLALDAIIDGVARIRVERKGNGPPPAALAGAIERAVAESAPDLEGVEIEGAPKPAAALVQIELATRV